MAPSEGFITDVAGIKVGHFTETRRPTGCTVVLCERGATASVDVRGSAPGTRETDLLDPINHVEQAHAILLSGGSAFGLDAATGVMRYLEERGIGYVTPFARVPIVPTASLRMSSNVVVAALMAVNCVGNVIDPANGKIVAGSRSPRGDGFMDVMDWARGGIPSETTNTTIGVIATNVAFSKTQLKKMAQMGHDGMARAINPVHTPWDGDTIFAISTADNPTVVDVGHIGSLAAEVVSRAILRAVRCAKSIPGYPSAQEVST